MFGGALQIPFGLTEMPAFFHESKGMYGVSDSSWGTKAKPQGGHVMMRTNAAVLWMSNRLKAVADSTAHAETAELSRLSKSAYYLRAVSMETRRPVMGPTMLLGDNKASTELAVKEGSSSKSRHFELATIFVKYAIQRLAVVVRLISTKMMIADIFTKAVDMMTFDLMRSKLRNIPLEGAGERARRVGAWVLNALQR